MRDYKAGDTIKLHGERMNGDGHIFTLTIAEVYPEAYENEFDSFVPFLSTEGHQFSHDKLVTKRYTSVGQYFYDVEIVNKPNAPQGANQKRCLRWQNITMVRESGTVRQLSAYYM